MNKDFNTRILIIDDEETVRDSFREILVPPKKQNEGLQSASAKLFQKNKPAKKQDGQLFTFQLTETANGKDGLEKVKESLEHSIPYAVIFVDMRMPGWDGLETVQHIRKIDERAEIIFVTAYSDHSIDEIVNKAGANVSYHSKPFEVEEIRQLATKSVFDYNKARNLEELINTISELRTHQWQLDPLLHNILQQVSEMLGSQSAMLIKHTQKECNKIIATGRFVDESIAQEYLSELDTAVNTQQTKTDKFMYFQIEKYGIIILFDKSHSPLQQERLYIVRLFLEQASQAVINVELYDKLIKQEKLSAIGQAISMISHDLRGPINSMDYGLELVLEDIDDRPDFSKEMLYELKKQSQKTLQIANDILDFARGSKPVFSEISTDTIFKSVKQSVQYIMENYSIEFPAITCSATLFEADETKIERVLVNLIRNAAEALHGSGTKRPEIHFTVSADDKEVVFEVKDNGPGIPEEIQGSLYEAFSTKGKKQGTGLGLAIVKQFVDNHGGIIEMKTSGNGTTFTVQLPKKHS